MSDSLAVPAHFNGPLDSGNGGYSAGALAAFLEGVVEVSLRRPVPLDRELRVERRGEDEVAAFDGEDLIAEARTAADFELEVPACSAGHRCRGRRTDRRSHVPRRAVCRCGGDQSHCPSAFASVASSR